MGAFLHFLVTHFYSPLVQDSGYNVYNTLVYAILLALVAIFLIPYLLKSFKINVDSKFAWGIFPYFILGAILRSTEDVGLFKSIWLISPLIWLLGLAFGILMFLLSILIQKKFKISYHYVWGGIATVISVVLLCFFKFSNWLALVVILIIFGLWLSLLLFTKFQTKINNWALFAIGAHLFDATVTYTAIFFFNFWEKHVLPRTLITYFGAWAMFPLKLVVLVPVVWYILKYVKKEDQTYYLLVVGAFGIITGFRDFVTLLTI